MGDSTQLTYAAILGFEAAVPHGYWCSATGFGTLGYGLPGAIGAAIGAPDRPVVSLIGDGGLMFTVGEMAAAVEAGARVIMLTHDNGGYGEIKTAMLADDVAPLGVDLTVPDLPGIAAACGWSVATPDTPEAMLEAVREAAGRSGPTMIRFDDDLRTAWRQ